MNFTTETRRHGILVVSVLRVSVVSYFFFSGTFLN